jgi:phospholipid transport system transporter-binding protein
VLILPAQLTHESVAEFARSVEAALLQQPDTIVADAAALKTFDSSAIALLLECRRRALQAGRSFAVHGAPARLTQLASLYGVAELIPANG